MRTNNIEIVKASIENIDDILIIENLCFKIPWSKQTFIDEITTNKSAIYLCAKNSDRTVGYAGLWHICDEGHITNIAVHPEFAGKGIGNTLLESLIDQARDLGILSMTLEVRKSNLIAQALYKKQGFENAGFRKAYYADNNEDAIIMWRNKI